MKIPERVLAVLDRRLEPEIVHAPLPGGERVGDADMWVYPQYAGLILTTRGALALAIRQCQRDSAVKYLPPQRVARLYLDGTLTKRAGAEWVVLTLAHQKPDPAPQPASNWNHRVHDSRGEYQELF